MVHAKRHLGVAQRLQVGGHGWGAILSPKGRVLSVVEATVDEVTYNDDSVRLEFTR